MSLIKSLWAFAGAFAVFLLLWLLRLLNACMYPSHWLKALILHRVDIQEI
ncbi:MAG: hypothetical protein NWE91_02730 [Candidatus Bathyarchaeota archaeon]|nr:hypothetical protein [Candidatus Bathyarchaeota archaeon]